MADPYSMIAFHRQRNLFLRYEIRTATRTCRTAMPLQFNAMKVSVCSLLEGSTPQMYGDSAVRVCAVTGFDTLKAVQHFLRPLVTFCLWRAQLINRSAVLVVGLVARSIAAAVRGRTVDVALGVEREALSSKLPVLAALEAVQHLLGPGFA